MSQPAVRAGRIRVLPPEVVAQIAAGEVIERPVSVLKELIENSLDAGATRCDVRVSGDLSALMEVADDGVGLSAEELPLALTRHATSKMPDGGDLHAVTTLGFRGEALPSIAQVARLTMETRTRDGVVASRAAAHGLTYEVTEAGRAPGTTVRVEGLFDDLPPRKKFLRSARSEVRAAERLVTAYALARPDVAFSLEVDGRVHVKLAAATSLAGRVRDIFEVDVEDGFLPLKGGTPPLSVHGFLGRPERHRSTREEQYFFVNGRWVQSGFLSQALRQGYRSLLPPDRHPSAVVLMELPGSEVDVNFHPTKREVRFAKESWVFSELRRAVEQGMAVLGRRETHVFGSHYEPSSSQDGGPGVEWMELFRTAAPLAGEVRDRLAEAQPTEDGADDALVAPREPLITLWQLHRTYILAPIRQGLLVVDQHAAHERILYEQALPRLRGKVQSGQALLFPINLHLDMEEFDTLLLIMPHLERLGFNFERLSGRSVTLRSIPAGMRRWEDGAEMRALLAEARRFASEPEGAEGVLERVARSFACHSAVKAGDKLEPEEMQALIDNLFATSLPHGDVHGRPTLIRLGLEDFERFFGRRRGQPPL